MYDAFDLGDPLPAGDVVLEFVVPLLGPSVPGGFGLATAAAEAIDHICILDPPAHTLAISNVFEMLTRGLLFSKTSRPAFPAQ